MTQQRHSSPAWKYHGIDCVLPARSQDCIHFKTEITKDQDSMFGIPLSLHSRSQSHLTTMGKGSLGSSSDVIVSCFGKHEVAMYMGCVICIIARLGVCLWILKYCSALKG